MTDLKVYRREIIRYRTVFLFCIFAAVSIGVNLGLSLSTAKNCIFVPRSPFENGGFFEGIIKVCLFDILSFWILTVPVSKTVTAFRSACLFFFRGIIIGNACRTFFVNSTPALCIVLLFSYITVTLFLLVYDAYVNTNGEKSTLSRILSCFIATGGCTLIRILPMLLIK